MKTSVNKPYETPFLILLLAWSAVILLIALWHHNHNHDTALRLAATEARSGYERDLAYRHWATLAGGLYVTTDLMRPNPYLDHPEREITTPSGRELTLVNPAYMTRTVYTYSNQSGKPTGRIISNQPLNPQNAPDAWEQNALAQLAAGAQGEVSGMSEYAGEQQLRFLGPLYANEACLRCHTTQGYSVGDLVGGISVTARWEPYQKELTIQKNTLLIGYGTLWLLGVLGLMDMRRRIQKSLESERSTRALLVQRERSLIQQSRVAAMGEMTSAIAHHWRQPLTVISLVVQDAQQAWESGELDDDYMKRTANKVKHLTEELSHTINILGGINTRREDLVFQNTLEPVETVIHLMRAQLSSHHITLALQHDQEPSELEHPRLYPSALRHAVINVILNARDAILIKRQEDESSFEGHITLTLASTPTQETIEVCDNGGGFSPEALQRALEPFYTTKEIAKGKNTLSGTGLGLYITKLIIEEQMQGTIEIGNQAEGARVSIILPKKP